MDRSTDSTKENDGKIEYENVCLISGFGEHWNSNILITPSLLTRTLFTRSYLVSEVVWTESYGLANVLSFYGTFSLHTQYATNFLACIFNCNVISVDLMQ